jgi:hypothetical protein
MKGLAMPSLVHRIDGFKFGSLPFGFKGPDSGPLLYGQPLELNLEA